jgi:hypothetical protein
MDWFRDALQIVTVLLLINIYYTVKNIRKVQSGGVGADTMAEFGTEVLKGMEDLRKEKKEQEKLDKK